MGYYVSLNESTAFIPADKTDEALRLFKELNEPKNNYLKTGGSFSGGGQTAYWYAWMPESFDHFTTAQEVLRELGFDVDVDSTGLSITGYDSKTGDEKLFFNAISHLIEPGSSMTWQGEDGDQYRWEFDGKTMTVKHGHISYLTVKIIDRALSIEGVDFEYRASW